MSKSQETNRTQVDEGGAAIGALETDGPRSGPEAGRCAGVQVVTPRRARTQVDAAAGRSEPGFESNRTPVFSEGRPTAEIEPLSGFDPLAALCTAFNGPRDPATCGYCFPGCMPPEPPIEERARDDREAETLVPLRRTCAGCPMTTGCLSDRECFNRNANLRDEPPVPYTTPWDDFADAVTTARAALETACEAFAALGFAHSELRASLSVALAESRAAESMLPEVL